jgi:hypothetical protein
MVAMYDTLIMLKPNATIRIEDVHRLVSEVAASGECRIEHDGSCIHLIDGSASLVIGWSDAPHVIEESNDIAKQFAIPCTGCHTRLEMNGDDPDMELFNDYLIINERLQETGQVIIFDTEECKLLFEDK